MSCKFDSKVIFAAMLAIALTGCSQGRYSSTITPSTTPANSLNQTTTGEQISTPAATASPTKPSAYLLDGDSQQQIIFAEFRLDNKGIYITSPFDNWTNHQVVNKQSGLAFYHSPSLSPDGERMLFAYDDGTGFRIYITDKNGNDLQPLIRSDDILPYQRYPAWSPDGSLIAFTVFNKLYVSSSSGSNIELLTEMSRLSYPVWSPDGKQIAFLADKKDNQSGLKLFAINKDGTNLQTLTNAIAGDSKISWSPDGKQIAFRSLDGCGDINTIHLANGMIDHITETPYMEKDPAWSPDGNYIAFALSSYTNCEKYVAESSYIPATLVLVNVRSHTVSDPMLLKGIETSLYEPSWWPTIVLRPNWKFSVTEAGSALKVHELPSKSAKSLIKLSQGAVFTVLEGPVDADNYQWWRIRTFDGIEGWCVDVPGWYILESTDLNS